MKNVTRIPGGTRPMDKRRVVLQGGMKKTERGYGLMRLKVLRARDLPVADVTAISFSSPLFTMVVAAAVLKEVVSGRRWLAAAVGFLGVLVIVRPGSTTFAPASLIALGTALIIGIEMAIIRRMARQDTPMMIVLSSNTLGSLFGLGLAASVWVWPTPAQWPFLVAVGSMTMLGQLLFARASALGEASMVAPFTYASILFAAVYGMLFFG